mmetsp:Transcript_21776/g.26453  ORF Transcript_21776/g.26453 Transcript_21776/m.26453 type:complete len:83 (-) Transcript_21776:250-498(-)
MSPVTEEEEVPDIELYDELAIKRTLDEQTCKIMKELGYEEELFWSNIKLVLMAGILQVYIYICTHINRSMPCEQRCHLEFFV